LESVSPRWTTPTVEFLPGDPALHVVGKSEEQSARRHAPLPVKPQTINEAIIRYNIEMRMDQLRPAVTETEKLGKMLAIIEDREPA